MEIQILDWLQTLRSPVGDFLMSAVTKLGDAGIFWILFTAVLLIVPKTRRCGIVLALSLLIDVFLCNIFLKPLIARERPFNVNTMVQLLVEMPKDFSFPSGHTAASFTVVSALWFYGAKRLCAVTLPIAVLIAASRLYLYVHYPTDVLGGIAVGIFAGFSGCAVCRKIWNITDRKKAEREKSNSR